MIFHRRATMGGVDKEIPRDQFIEDTVRLRMEARVVKGRINALSQPPRARAYPRRPRITSTRETTSRPW